MKTEIALNKLVEEFKKCRDIEYKTKNNKIFIERTTYPQLHNIHKKGNIDIIGVYTSDISTRMDIKVYDVKIKVIIEDGVKDV